MLVEAWPGNELRESNGCDFDPTLSGRNRLGKSRGSSNLANEYNIILWMIRFNLSTLNKKTLISMKHFL